MCYCRVCIGYEYLICIAIPFLFYIPLAIASYCYSIAVSIHTHGAHPSPLLLLRLYETHKCCVGLILHIDTAFHPAASGRCLSTKFISFFSISKSLLVLFSQAASLVQFLIHCGIASTSLHWVHLTIDRPMVG